ncbi:MAG: UDP-2,3-diacylglucosamine diphosphatase [Bacteroidota bacterium]|nr:UDP-2,3-diacylglucosamine diphosphatase [Bacteroidota bacterium]
MELPPGKKIYFLSDFHLGAPNYESSLKREKKIVAFLDNISSTAAAIFIVGDMFDFWFEYNCVIPKGYTRLLGKLAEITDSGIPIHFFVGNHDMWMRGYFEQELNIAVYFDSKQFEWNGKRFFIAHGDGLGPGDHGYKLIKKVFRNRISRFLFGLLHPSWGIGLANFFSRKSRKKTGTSDEVFLGEEKEWLVIFSKEVLAKEHFDFFIFGHRHLPLDIKLSDKSRYINLGDWIKYFTYAEFDGEHTYLKKMD